MNKVKRFHRKFTCGHEKFTNYRGKFTFIGKLVFNFSCIVIYFRAMALCSISIIP